MEWDSEGKWKTNRSQKPGKAKDLAVEHIDEDVFRYGLFKVRIKHVRGHNNRRGFMAAVVKAVGGPYEENCKLFYGTNEATYQKAHHNGCTICLERDGGKPK